MSKQKLEVALDTAIIRELDRLVQEAKFPSRSSVIENALEQKFNLRKRERLAQACAELDPVEEKAFAEEGMAESAQSWPEY